MEPSWLRVQDEAALRNAFASATWDVVLIDHAMPGFDGSAALAIVREVAPQAIPIVVSGSIGEELAVDAIRHGASDYILKDRLLRLPAAIRRELTQADAQRARIAVEQRMQDMASHDAVTGLPNRAVLEEAIARGVALAPGGAGRFAIVLLELERFVAIRNAFGHAVGDDVLRLVGRRLAAACPPAALLANTGTQEFGLLLPQAGEAEAQAICAELCAAFDEPLVLGSVPILVEPALGISLYPEHGRHGSLLLRNASLALQDARALGRSCATYTARRNGSESDELILLGELRSAIESEQLFLEYQPVVALADQRVVGAEALVRWEHPRRGRVPPGNFVPQSENCGLIHPLTHFVLRTALGWSAAQRRAGRRLTTAVNFSTRSLLDAQILTTIRAELAAAEVPAAELEIEITESTLMADPRRARAVLEELRALGVRLAIDDFGTGYSSFAYLRDLPVHKVKIDRAFVARLTSSARDAVIVHAIIDLAHTLGLTVAAEGVEDQASIDLLAASGCDLVQGYHIGRPMGAARFDAWRGEWDARATAPARALDALPS
ncbi:MAG: GGDEF domain-containing response regulator [Planctomycetota bacterium]|nr:MAG: GGDEF domain-containing response regulator [Planctomycetota bacterium]